MSADRVRLGHRLEATAYDILTGTMRLFSFDAVSGFGGWLFQLIGPLTSKQKIARRNLSLAFPEMPEAERNTLLRTQWNNIGRTFAEFPLTDRIEPFADNRRVKIDGLDIFRANAPAIIVTGHFANWEVMATVLTQSDLPVRITYRKINNPLIDARVRAQREAYGTQFLIQKSTHRGGRELLEALQSGESVALLNDQKFNTGLSLPFFGKPAMTAPGAVRLALKTDRPLLPMSVMREKANFRVRFHNPISLIKTGHRGRDVEVGVRQVNAFIEDRIRENPDQWFWVHRRWPKDHYKS